MYLIMIPRNIYLLKSFQKNHNKRYFVFNGFPEDLETVVATRMLSVSTTMHALYMCFLFILLWYFACICSITFLSKWWKQADTASSTFFGCVIITLNISNAFIFLTKIFSKDLIFGVTLSSAAYTVQFILFYIFN